MVEKSLRTGGDIFSPETKRETDVRLKKVS